MRAFVGALAGLAVMRCFLDAQDAHPLSSAIIGACVVLLAAIALTGEGDR